MKTRGRPRPEVEAVSAPWLAVNFDMDSRTVRKRLARAGIKPVERNVLGAFYAVKEAVPAILMGELSYLMPEIRRLGKSYQPKKMKIVTV